MNIRITTVIALLLSLSATVAAEDWPTWQHDNRRTGATSEELPTENLELDWTWKSSAPPVTAWAGPAKYDAYAGHRNLPSMRNYDSVFHMIAVRDRVWFGSSVDDSLYCLDAGTGDEKWVVTVDGPVRLAPTWSDGRIYFGSDDGSARCVNAADGKLIWAVSPSHSKSRVLNNGRFVAFQPCRTGVVVDGSTAWFACAMLPWEDAFLCAVDSRTGKVSSPDHYIRTLQGRTMEGAPALSSGALILPQGRVAPRVFDRTNGDDLGEMAKSGGGSVVVVSVDESVFHGPASDSRKGGFRKSSGSTREMVAALGRGNALVVDDAHSWMLTDDAIIASKLGAGEPLWKVQCDCPFAMIKAGSTLFVGGESEVSAYSTEDGRELWRRPAHGRIFGLVAANGRLFATSDTGVIHCYSKNGTKSPAERSEPTTAHSDARDRNENTVVLPVTKIDDERLLDHWAFQQTSATGAQITALTGSDLTLSGKARFSPLGRHQAIELDGQRDTVMVSPDFRSVPHPISEFTAEAWVRLDQLQEWGSIVGVVQDNGDYEKGWSLGYRKDRFSVAVSSADGPGRMTYLTSDEPFQLSRWYHVAGTYDGSTMRLFVDGRLCAESKAQAGKVAYPDRAWFEIGAYHDQDEYFRMTGGLHEVRLYREALAQEEIEEHFQSAKSRIPQAVENAEVASGPWLTFNDPSSATVRWTTTEPQPTRLEYGRDSFSRTWSDDEPKTEHAARLDQLDHHRVYQYRIAVSQSDGVRYTQTWECDNFFNYSPHLVDSFQDGESTGGARQIKAAEAGRNKQRGMALVIGSPAVDTLTELCLSSGMRIVVAADDQTWVDSVRPILRSRRLYGSQISVTYVADLTELPFQGNWANLVIVGSTPTAQMINEAKHQARPGGGVVRIDARGETRPTGFRMVEGNGLFSVEPASRHAGSVLEWTKPAVDGAGQWTHLYGGPNNSAFGGEQLSGVQSTSDLAVQWVGRPGPRYQADRNGRKPSPLSIGGQLFLQGLHRIVAVDAFNGTIQWSIEIPGLERFNMPRDCSNWCAASDALYAAVRDECWKIDTATGEVTARIPADAGAEIPVDWGFLAASDGRLYGSAVRRGTAWTSFWGNADAGWYDARSGAVTHPICSDKVFCLNPDSTDLIWEYKRGVVLNPTITISDDTMYFVECRHPSILASDKRRIGDALLWKNLHLVAVDARSGSPKWEKKLPPMDPSVIFYVAHASEQLTLVSSSDKSYRVQSLSDHDGSERWTQTTPWPGGKGDHGKAMMHPAIVGDRIILRPNVLSLKDGSVLPEKMPDGHGCGTYSCTADAVFYRAGTLTMWNPETQQKSTWSRLRPDCWLSTVPAGGMLLSPEGGGGCSCGSWMETSIGFIPRSLTVR